MAQRKWFLFVALLLASCSKTQNGGFSTESSPILGSGSGLESISMITDAAPQSSGADLTVAPFSIHGGTITPAKDTFVFGSIWTGTCLEQGKPMGQRLGLYLGPLNLGFAADHLSYRAIGTGGIVPGKQISGTAGDLIAKCGTKNTSPLGGSFSLGTNSAQAPIKRDPNRPYRADTAGFLIASAWVPTASYYQTVSVRVGPSKALSEDNVVAFSAGTSNFGTGNVVVPVNANEWYEARLLSIAAGSEPLVYFMPVPGLQFENAPEEMTFAKDYPTDVAGFVLASSWTGSCTLEGYTMDQISVGTRNAKGEFVPRNERRVYAPYEAGSSLTPVAAGETVYAGHFCKNSVSKIRFIRIKN